jgi:hypothetical protein
MLRPSIAGKLAIILVHLSQLPPSIQAWKSPKKAGAALSSSSSQQVSQKYEFFGLSIHGYKNPHWWLSTRFHTHIEKANLQVPLVRDLPHQALEVPPENCLISMVLGLHQTEGYP